MSKNVVERRDLNKYYIAAILYMTFIALLTVILEDNIVLVTPLFLMFIIISLSFKFKIGYPLTQLVILSLYILYSSLNYLLFMLLIPLACVIPFLFIRQHTVELESTSIPIGPTITGLLKYTLYYSIIVFINPLSMLSLITVVAIALVYAIIEYARLCSISVELMSVPRRILLGSKSDVLFSVSSPRNVILILSTGNSKYVVYSIKGNSTIKFPLEGNSIGRYVTTITAIVLDEKGFSRRLLLSYAIEYSVVPVTKYAIELLRERMHVTEEVASTPSIEITVIESPGGELTVESRGIEGAKSFLKELLSYILTWSRRPLEEMFGRASVYQGAVPLHRGKGSRAGEYIGARYYVPGDNLKDIHWKKSISKGILIVKEYAELGKSIRVGYSSKQLGPIIIADLFATSSKELDRIMYRLLNTLVNIALRNPRATIILVLIAGDMVVALRGGAVDLLYRILVPIEKALYKIMYEYESMSKPLEPEIIAEIQESPGKPKPLRIIMFVNLSFAERILSLLINSNILPPRPYTIVHGKATSMKYSVLKYKLNRLGYGFINVDELPLTKFSISVSKLGERLWSTAEEY